MNTLIARLRDEAGLCRNGGATDIANLLDEAAEALGVKESLTAQAPAEEEEAALIQKLLGALERSIVFGSEKGPESYAVLSSISQALGLALALPSHLHVNAEFLRSRLIYDPSTGIFTRRISGPNAPAGSIAGSIRKDGYLSVNLRSRAYLAHRVAWCYMTGEWPQGDIDHIDGNPSNNRWLNLRDVTSAFNSGNTVGKGYRYVGKNLKKPFHATINIDGRAVSLGYFLTAREAREAYLLARMKTHPEGQAANAYELLRNPSSTDSALP